LYLFFKKTAAMKKVYYLSTCTTCKRIMQEIELPSAFIKQDIKVQGITADELEELYNLSGSYKALFSKRAKLFKEKNIDEDSMLDEDYRDLLLIHYTFLRRPIIVNNDEIFIGNSDKTVAAAKKSIH